MAEGLLRRRLIERGIDAHVHSAGLRLDGEPASPFGVEVMADRGVDVSRHRSRVMQAAIIEEADLVVAMAKEHLLEAVLAAPDAWSRAFTLKELVRRGEASGARAPGEALAGWLTRVNAGRERADILASSTDEDVDDPIGLDRTAYERTADELTDLIDRLVDLAWPAAAQEAG